MNFCESIKLEAEEVSIAAERIGEMRGDREHRPSQSLIDLSWGRRCRTVE
jgi:hypothetical protein